MKNKAPVKGEILPLTGPGIRPPTPTSGAINSGTDSQKGAGERGFRKGEDRRLGTGGVYGNVSKSDRGDAGRDRSRGCWKGVVVGVTVGEFRIL